MIKSDIPFLEENAAAVAIIIFFLGLLFTAVFARYQTHPLKDELSDPESWEIKIRELRRPASEKYFSTIEHVCDVAKRFFGIRLFGLQAFERCLALAYFYPVTALFFGWIFADAGSLGGVELISSGMDVSDRIWHGVAALGGYTLLFLFFFLSVKIPRLSADMRGSQIIMLRDEQYTVPMSDNVPENLSGENFDTNNEMFVDIARALRRVINILIWALIVSFLVLLVAYAIGNAFIVVGVVAFIAVFAGAVFLGGISVLLASAAAISLVVACVTFGYALENSQQYWLMSLCSIVAIFLLFIFLAVSLKQEIGRAGAASVAFAISGYVAISYFISSNYQLPTTVIMFFVILPIFNALADLASIAITRGFLDYLHKFRPGLGRILAHLCFDFLLALICFILLLGSILVTLEVWSATFPGTLAFNWRSYRAEVLEGNWGSGAIIYLMLITTFIPTIVHITAGVAAFLTHKARLWSEVANRLEKQCENVPKKPIPLVEINSMVRKLFWGRFVGVLGAIFVVAVFSATAGFFILKPMSIWFLSIFA